MLNEYGWIDQRMNDLRNEAAEDRLARNTRRRRNVERRARHGRRLGR